jgi:hypothetical protein
LIRCATEGSFNLIDLLLTCSRFQAMVFILALLLTFVQVASASPTQGTCALYNGETNTSKCKAHSCSSCFSQDPYAFLCYNSSSDTCCAAVYGSASVCRRGTHSCAVGHHESSCCDLSKTKPCGEDQMLKKGFDSMYRAICIPKDSSCCANKDGMMPNVAFGCKKGSTCCAGGLRSLCCDDATEVCVPAPSLPRGYSSPKCVKKSVVV